MTDQKHTKEQFTELFALQLRGAVATAFAYSNAPISETHWKMLRGETEFTMRDIGEIGHITGFDMHLQLRPITEGGAE